MYDLTKYDVIGVVFELLHLLQLLIYAKQSMTS